MSKRTKRGRPIPPRKQNLGESQRQAMFLQGRRLRWGVLAVLATVLAWNHAVWLPAIPLWRTRLALVQRRLDDAHSWLDVAVRVAPSDPEIEFLRARVFRKQGEFSKVREHLQRAYDLGIPKDRVEREQWLALAQSGQLSKAAPHFSELLRDPREDGQEICAAFVNGYFLNYRYAEAFTLLDVWIKDFPDDPVPFLFRGRIHAKLQKHRDAEENLRHAWKLDADYSEAVFDLAEILRIQKRPDEALQFYRQLSETASKTRVKTRIGEVKCLRMLGRTAESRRVLQKLLADDASLVEAQSEIGHIELEAGHYESAIRWIRLAHDQNPQDVELRYALASALRGNRDLEEATIHFNAVKQARAALSQIPKLTGLVVKKPEDIESRYKIGVICLGYGSQKEGVGWLQSVLEYDSNHNPTLKALADFYERRSEDAPEYAEMAKRYRSLARNVTSPAIDGRD
jgi:tetratricopeptide (TPR) repeat protein